MQYTVVKKYDREVGSSGNEIWRTEKSLKWLIVVGNSYPPEAVHSPNGTNYFELLTIVVILDSIYLSI